MYNTPSLRPDQLPPPTGSALSRDELAKREKRATRFNNSSGGTAYPTDTPSQPTQETLRGDGTPAYRATDDDSGGEQDFYEVGRRPAGDRADLNKLFGPVRNRAGDRERRRTTVGPDFDNREGIVLSNPEGGVITKAKDLTEFIASIPEHAEAWFDSAYASIDAITTLTEVNRKLDGNIAVFKERHRKKDKELKEAIQKSKAAIDETARLRRARNHHRDLGLKMQEEISKFKKEIQRLKEASTKQT